MKIGPWGLYLTTYCQSKHLGDQVRRGQHMPTNTLQEKDKYDRFIFFATAPKLNPEGEADAESRFAGQRPIWALDGVLRSLLWSLSSSQAQDIPPSAGRQRFKSSWGRQ